MDVESLTLLERTLIQTLRCARILYQDGDEESARRVLHHEAIPMLAACVQEVSMEYGPLTGARSEGMAKA